MPVAVEEFRRSYNLDCRYMENCGTGGGLPLHAGERRGMKKAIVTGVTGFISRALVEELARYGYQVWAVSRRDGAVGQYILNRGGCSKKLLQPP